MSKDYFYGYAKVSITENQMSKVMYALLITNSNLVNSHHLGLEKYTRGQNSGAKVDCVFEIEKSKQGTFERLSGLILKTSDEFQGKMKLNTSSND